MKKILFYCQHLLGVGHLTRSLALCEALAEGFEVDLLQGGPDIGLASGHPRLRRIQLPPLLMREDDSSLYDPIGGESAAKVFERRWRFLARVASRRYDHLLVELFPFGRRKFRGEILGLIEALKRANSRFKVHCSLRDVVYERDDGREAETLERLRLFDSVLVHSDPHVIRLQETFRRTADIPCRVEYTGFVARRHRRARKASRAPRILVSLGGGAVGGRLAEAAIDVADRLPGYEFRLALGPHTPSAARAALTARARGRANVRVGGFLRDFHGALGGASLSVSLAGYNTVMDLLRTRTPGVVLPYDANREQELRARRFEAAGVLAVATEKDLRPARFEALLRRGLRLRFPDLAVDLDGAERTRRFLEAA